ncbi:PEGA domain-containing protein [Candidatus Microgenomates bacterium]|nr:PEGA domain-containing protein [Candidatus Microgenomates bacterium]
MLRRTLLLSFTLIALVGVGIFIFRDKIFAKNAGLAIETEPTATVFINGEQGGTTPFKIQQKPGNVEVKLIPFSQDTPLAPYQTEVTLVNGIETVVRRTFGPTEAQSSGEVLYFEKVGGKTAQVSVVSNPDTLEVSLDGKSIGFTPLRSNVEPGQHTLKLSGAGVDAREINDIRAIKDYKLTAVVKLAQLPEEKPEASPLASPSASPIISSKQVEILTTPTGFLRVRAEASTGSAEIGRVTPGNRYKLIEKNTANTWFKIEYLPAQAGEPTKSGWISAQYAKEIL